MRIQDLAISCVLALSFVVAACDKKEDKTKRKKAEEPDAEPPKAEAAAVETSPEMTCPDGHVWTFPMPPSEYGDVKWQSYDSRERCDDLRNQIIKPIRQFEGPNAALAFPECQCRDPGTLR